MEPTILQKRSFSFAVEIVFLSQDLQTSSKEFILSKQVLRSGTAIGAMIREAKFAESRADFIHKMSIVLKEANETEYWLLLLSATGLSQPTVVEPLTKEVNELIAMLVSSIKKLKGKKDGSVYLSAANAS